MGLLKIARDFLTRRAREAAVVLALAGLGLIYLGTARPVVIVVDGQSRGLRTHARTVAAALHDAGLDPAPEDILAPDPDTALTAGMTIRLDRAHPVVVEADGERRVVRTAAHLPANVLAQAGIRLYPGDALWVDGLRLADPASALESVPTRVRVARAAEFSVVEENGTVHRLRSAVPNLAQALWDVGMRLVQGDHLAPTADTPLLDGLRVDLRGTRRVTIQAEGREFEARVGGSSVGEALAEVGLAPVGLDYAIPDLEQPLPEDGVIRLVRVREEMLVEQEPLPFETVYEAIPDLEIDNQRIIEPGAYGVVVHQVRIRLEDGEEVERTVEGEWTAVEPRPQRVGYGTQIVLRTLDTPDGVIEYWRAVRMYATSYSPSRAGTSPDAPWYGITYSGKPLRKGLVAIDPRYIPMGTMMYVPGYGFAQAADIGGGVRGRWIDLGYSDDDFVNWHQWVTVYFLTPVPPASNIVWIFP
ncbi:MAG: ubiquitin-like domain-containing protein [Chloroflexota bacterium]